MQSRIDKIAPMAELNKLDFLLFTSPASVKYLSCFFNYFEYGSSPFHFIPSALFIIPGKSLTLIIADNEVY